MRARFMPDISVRSKLILTSLAVSAFLLVLLGCIAHQWQQRAQTAKIDTFLLSEAGATAAVISTIVPDGTSETPKISAAANSKKLIAKLQVYLKNRVDRPAVYKTTLGIYDGGNANLVRSNNALPIDPAELQKPKAKFSEQQSFPGHAQLATVHIGDLVFRIIIVPVRLMDATALTIRLACLLTPAVEETHDFDRSLVVVLSIIGLLAGFGSFFLITRTLQPVNAMRLAADRITERNLDFRIPMTAGKDEISNLSRTFNRLLTRIEEAYRHQVQLVEDLSHQLKTPLTILRSSIDLALRNASDRTQYRQALQDGLADIDRLSALLVTILGLARLESKSVALNPEKADIAILLHDLVDDMEALWLQNRLRVTLSLNHGGTTTRLTLFPKPKSSPIPGHASWRETKVDTFLISQAFMNILSNAFTYCPVDGEIDILVEELNPDDPGMLRIVFYNSGPTIPPAELEDIFGRFYTRDPSAAPGAGPESPDIPWEIPQGKGFGLGLSIARNCVELHKGGIRAFTPEKPGAAFEILLPRI